MSVSPEFSKDALTGFRHKHDFLVGIDSDGTVFPTMEIKQKHCIHKLIVSHWQLEKIERCVRETAEFVNLHSRHRGQNRFRCLVLSMDLIRHRSKVNASGVKLPSFESLKKFVDSGSPLSNLELKKRVEKTNDAELASVLKWSEDVNAEIAKTVKNVAPFKRAVKALKLINKHADAICVSQTPTETLAREWRENGLIGCVKAIAGQELGSKTEHLRMVSEGHRYPAGNILMIGDALDDLRAVKSINGHFFSINPGSEEESWKLFSEEAFQKFLDGGYGGAYEKKLFKEFRRLLPDTPPWMAKTSRGAGD